MYLVFYGGIPIQKDAEISKNKDTHPHIIVATPPSRLNALVRDKHFRLNSCKDFVLDKCDKMLDQVGMMHLQGVSQNPNADATLDMRRDVQEIFRP